MAGVIRSSAEYSLTIYFNHFKYNLLNFYIAKNYGMLNVCVIIPSTQRGPAVA